MKIAPRIEYWHRQGQGRNQTSRHATGGSRCQGPMQKETRSREGPQHQPQLQDIQRQKKVSCSSASSLYVLFCRTTGYTKNLRNCVQTAVRQVLSADCQIGNLGVAATLELGCCCCCCSEVGYAWRGQCGRAAAGCALARFALAGSVVLVGGV
jgi:hypothetical protein